MDIFSTDVQIFRLVGPDSVLPRRRKAGGTSDVQTRTFYKAHSIKSQR
jgi:hypothetical protein